MRQRIFLSCVAGLVMLAFVGFGFCQEVIELTGPADRDGYLWVNYLAPTGNLVAGSHNASGIPFAGVFKIPIEVTDPCDPNVGQSFLGSEHVYSATLQMNLNYFQNHIGHDAVYVQLQHYTYDNDGLIGEETDGSGYYVDYTTTSVENVGGEIAITSYPLKLNWDITAQVEADRAAGHKYTSFRVVSTDGAGTLKWAPAGGYGAFFNSADNGSAIAPQPTIYVEMGGLQRVSKAPATMEGYISASGTTINQTTCMVVGNNNNNPFGYRGVIKFPLNGATDLTSAMLNAWRIRGLPGNTGYGGAYVQLQHYTYDNATAVQASDSTTTDVENVGGPVFLADHPAEPYYTPLEWDVSDYVAADSAAGFVNSAFRILPVDENGDYFNEPTNYAGYICSQHPGGFGWAPNNETLYPRLADMAYQPPLELKPTTEREGWRYHANDTAGNNDTWLAVGNLNHLHTLCSSMVKFRLDDVVPCSNAQLKIWQNAVNVGGAGYGGTYVKLQWCHVDSLMPVSAADTTDPNYQDVGGPVLIVSGATDPYTWDVTDELNEAITNGFSYCAFRIRPCDINGDWPMNPEGQTIFTPYFADFYSQDSGWPGSGNPPANPTLYPRIAVTYDPFNCADVYDRGFEYKSDLTHDCYVNEVDLAVIADEWLGCTTPGGAGCIEQLSQDTGTIVRGTATVDGDLSDWDDQLEWVPLNVVIYGDPCDVTDARIAMRWNEDTNKIYAAVKITDTHHWLTDGNLGWDQADCIEVYSQGDGKGGTYNTQVYSDIAQQYIVGLNTVATGGAWATWPNAMPVTGNPDPGFEYAAAIVGNELHYEVGVQQFDNYAGRLGTPGTTVYTDLNLGDKVRFDILCDTRWGDGPSEEEFGMLASTDAVARFQDANAIAEYVLVETTPCGGWGYLAADMNLDCEVDLNDFAEFSQQWLFCNDPTDLACIKNWQD